MTLLRHLPAAAVALLLVAHPASARPLTDAEEQALADRVVAMEAGLRDGDYGALVQMLSPRLLRHFEEEIGLTAGQLVELMAQAMETGLGGGATLEYFRFELSGADYRELDDGEPYALIPTEMVFGGSGVGRVRVRSYVLAFIDGGTWYLVSVGDLQQVMMLRQVYPEFVGIEFPRGSMEALN